MKGTQQMALMLATLALLDEPGLHRYKVRGVRDPSQSKHPSWKPHRK
jgi:hypothetical protein